MVEALAGEGRTEAKVVVHVDDQNDHAPVFLRALHETQITEEDNRHLPKVILKVRAHYRILPNAADIADKASRYLRPFF